MAPLAKNMKQNNPIDSKHSINKSISVKWPQGIGLQDSTANQNEIFNADIL